MRDIQVAGFEFLNFDDNLYVYENGKIIDQRLVGKGLAQQSTLKIAITSCSDDSKPEHFDIWNTLASKNPEYLLMIGDNVYADHEPSGSSINEPWITFETDERGRFFIENVVAEDYDIACLYPQYQLKLVSGVRARRIGSKPEVEAIFLSAPTLK